MNHFIQSIQIENYKSIKDINIELSGFTPLVGYNNAGKSNILEAINWLIKKSKLKDTDFKDSKNPITVTAVINGITEDVLSKINEAHRGRIEPFVNSETLTIRRTQSVPNAAASQFKLKVKDSETGEWKTNPTGIDNAISALFPEPIRIGAMENAEEDVSKSKTSTTIGKLIAEIIGPIETKYEDNLKATIDKLKDVLGMDGVDRAAELTEFDSQVNKKAADFFPNIEVKIDIPTPEIKDVLNNGTIKVFEDHTKVPIDVGALGHGAQRSIQMALIRHLADIKQNVEGVITTTLLLIDEPELYLHPQAIEILRSALKKLSGQGYQIVFTTHSPFMVTQDDISNTVLIRKNSAKGTHNRKTLRSSIKEIEENAKHQLSLMFALSNSSNILFSEKVILAEGKTENNLLPFLLENVTNETLGVHKCALVKLEGCKNTAKSIQVLKVMDLPCKALVDLDYCFTQAIKDQFIEENDVDIQACRNKLLQLERDNDSIKLQNGLPANNGATKAASVYVLLASQPDVIRNIENLKHKLRDKNIWLWNKGTIETHLKLTEKSESAWADFKQQVKDSELNTVLADNYDEVCNCVNWLIS